MHFRLSLGHSTLRDLIAGGIEFCDKLLKPQLLRAGRSEQCIPQARL